jgi:hypothetical protein
MPFSCHRAGRFRIIDRYDPSAARVIALCEVPLTAAADPVLNLVLVA